MDGLSTELLGTVIVIAVVVAANFAITQILARRASLSRETKLRTSILWRNLSLFLAIVALFFVWRAELRAAVLSLAALSVALVISGKELITSVFGYIYRATAGGFRFGDVIEINQVKGEVIDQTLLSTTLLEMNDEHLFTGRVVQFPNSLYVTHALVNYSRIGNYQLGLLEVPLRWGADVGKAKQELQQVAAGVCADYVAPTQAALRELEGEQFLLMPSAEPRVSLRLMDNANVTLLLRYPCPSARRTRTEQEILERYLAASAPLAAAATRVADGHFEAELGAPFAQPGSPRR
jgi:small-conductance mechanosensitive channel